MIMVREPEDPAPSAVEYRHGLTPPMKDARKRRFRREPDLNVLINSIFFKTSIFAQISILESRRNGATPIYKTFFSLICGIKGRTCHLIIHKFNIFSVWTSYFSINS